MFWRVLSSSQKPEFVVGSLARICRRSLTRSKKPRTFVESSKFHCKWKFRQCSPVEVGKCAFFRVDQGLRARRGEAGCRRVSLPGIVASPVTGPERGVWTVAFLCDHSRIEQTRSCGLSQRRDCPHKPTSVKWPSSNPCTSPSGFPRTIPLNLT